MYSEKVSSDSAVCHQQLRSWSYAPAHQMSHVQCAHDGGCHTHEGSVGCDLLAHTALLLILLNSLSATRMLSISDLNSRYLGVPAMTGSIAPWPTSSWLAEPATTLLSAENNGSCAQPILNLPWNAPLASCCTMINSTCRQPGTINSCSNLPVSF